jgi:protein tyrosine/serine phosphatase
MNRFLSLFSFVVLILTSNCTYGGYDNLGNGFYLKHYAQMKDLKDTSCKQFLKTVYRGGQPVFDGSTTWIDRIKASKIKVVFDLREETKNAALERDTLLKNGIGYVKLPLRTSGDTQAATMNVEVAMPGANKYSSPIITKSVMDSVAATKYVLELMQNVISEQSENGIYLHCQRGEDRTGLMIALLRECNGTAWKSEFLDYGGVMYKPLQQLMNDVKKLRR